jgi:myo-inositol 2-dehydrogenase / D-chiro-inositol 1-dehydrogenase
MADTLRLGLIGAGGVTVQHLPALRRLNRTTLVGVVCRTVERARETTDEWGGAPYASTGQMLDEQRPDVVWVCLPPASQGWACEIIAERGIPFFTEKPLSAEADIPVRVAALVRDKRLVSAVGYNWRALDFLPEVRERFRERPPHLVVARWIGDTPKAQWWTRRDRSGGQVIEQATHEFDLARVLLGEATVIAAESARHDRPSHPDADIDDVSAALLRFDSGAIGSFASTCLTRSSVVRAEFASEGLTTTIALDGHWPGFRWSVTFDEGRTQRRIEAGRDPFEAQAERFLDAVVATDPDHVLCTYEDALRTDRLTRAVVAATGRPG